MILSRSSVYRSAGEWNAFASRREITLSALGGGEGRVRWGKADDRVRHLTRRTPCATLSARRRRGLLEEANPHPSAACPNTFLKRAAKAGQASGLIRRGGRLPWRMSTTCSAFHDAMLWRESKVTPAVW